jgi:hypothetical protein
MDMAAEVHRSVIEILIAQAAGHCATFADLVASLPGVSPDEQPSRSTTSPPGS